MGVLNLTLPEEGVAVLRDALMCMSKFSEEVTIEAKRDSFSLSAITVSKNAYAHFSCPTGRFFTKYRFEGNAQFREKFFCTLYTRTLIAILRPRSSSSGSTTTTTTTTTTSNNDGEKQSAIERCDISVRDGHDIKSRFIAKFIFRNGITTRHRIPFESRNPVHAKFNKHEATNTWAISARTLRQLMEQHVSSGADLLDIHSDEDNVVFTYYTEKPHSEDEVLRKPLHTSIAVDVEEFETLDLEDGLHIVMTVKDFRAVIHHASMAGSSILARYSVPGRPLQFSYQSDGVACEFLVMTVGERNNPGQKTTKRKTRPAGRDGPRALEESSHRGSSAVPSEAHGRDMAQLTLGSRATTARVTQDEPTPVPRASASRFAGFDLRPTQMQMTQMQGPSGTAPPEGGLFVDDDQQWESLDAQDEAEQLDEDARIEYTYDIDESISHIREAGAQRSISTGLDADTVDDMMVDSDMVIEPTQRRSDVAGLGLFCRAKTS